MNSERSIRHDTPAGSEIRTKSQHDAIHESFSGAGSMIMLQDHCVPQWLEEVRSTATLPRLYKH